VRIAKVLQPFTFLLAAALALVSAPLWVPAALAAVTPAPAAWPAGSQVRVYDASGWTKTVRVAAATWNRTGVTPPIVLVASRADADAVVESGDRLLAERCAPVAVDCDGYSSRVGWRGGRTPVTITLPTPRAGADARLVEEAEQVAAHELGHVLGLSHDASGCRLMNPGSIRGGCAVRLWTRDVRGRFLCGPLGPDVAAARRLYGGRVAEGYSPWCATGGRAAQPRH
jgi:hypothetical protein